MPLSIFICCLITQSAITASAQSPDRRFGVVSFSWNASDEAAIQDLGVGTVRGSCRWKDMQSNSSTSSINWGCTDAVIFGATGSGLRVLMTINCTPTWANSGATDANCNSRTPTNMQHWSDFVSAFVNRYSSYDVTLGIWNEPNIAEGGTMSYTSYCSMFQTALAARGSSSMPLAGPETSWHGVSSGYFSNAMQCMRPYMASQDKVTHHYYPDATISLSQTMQNLVFYADGLEVWLSEVGIDTTNAATQATFYNNFVDSFDDLSLTYPTWTSTVFYRLWANDSHAKFAILNADYSRKPAFDTYAGLITELTGAGSGAMSPGESLGPNQSVFSQSGGFQVVYQGDGNLVLYNGSMVDLWDSQTYGTTPSEAAMQGDGNFVVYDTTQAVWWSGTDGNTNAYLVVQSDGDLRIYNSSGRPIYNFSR